MSRNWLRQARGKRLRLDNRHRADQAIAGDENEVSF